MRKLISIGVLTVAVIACSAGLDTMGEIMDAGIPDAGAQPGELIVPCDVVYQYSSRSPSGGSFDNTRIYAEVAASDLTGPFVAQLCVDAEEGILGLGCAQNLNWTCSGEYPPPPKCVFTGHEVMSDGRFRFRCDGLGTSPNNYLSDDDAPYVKIIR